MNKKSPKTEHVAPGALSPDVDAQLQSILGKTDSVQAAEARKHLEQQSNLIANLLAEALAEQVRPGQDVNSDGPKALLRANTEAAQAAGVFGVPAYGVDGKLFWGLDGLPMLRAYLDGDAWFDGPAWDAVSQLPSGLPGKS